MPKGGALVSYGNYGCVYDPPVECGAKSAKGKNPIKRIGKVFNDPYVADIELDEYKKIATYDPQNAFTVPNINECYVKGTAIRAAEGAAKRCPFVDDDLGLYRQLVFAHGGIDFLHYCHAPDAHGRLCLEDIVKLFVPVFKGVQHLGAHRFCHFDIKPENVLLDVTVPKVNLIDFGLSKSFSAVHAYGDEYYQRPYFVYPPELKLVAPFRAAGGPFTQDLSDQCKRAYYENFTSTRHTAVLEAIKARWPEFDREVAAFFNGRVGKTGASAATWTAVLDSYSLAITLIYICVALGGSADFVDRLMTTVLLPMIHPDPEKRMLLAVAVPLIESMVPGDAPKAVSRAKTSRAPKAELTTAMAALTTSPAPNTFLSTLPKTMEECQKLPNATIKQYLDQIKNTHDKTVKVTGTKDVMCHNLMAYMKRAA